MLERFEQIISTDRVRPEDGTILGRSREARPVRGFRVGTGSIRVSLIGGCHADEPVGPLFLRHLAAYLGRLAPGDPLRSRYEWWIVPHVNPDGEVRNRTWYDDDDPAFDLATYLVQVVRELPGDDIEFGFPRNGADLAARPENRALFNWWHRADGPFTLHATLHGMAFAAGPWFLVEQAWRDRIDHLKTVCRTRVTDLGYRLHDVERHGEKGFFRLERGFTTRPDSGYMRRHFSQLGDEETASRFRPSSMETIRALNGDPLTVVSEMPLFITPGVGEELGPPDPVAEEWKTRIARWRSDLAGELKPDEVREEAATVGLQAMPVRQQMDLQWTLIVAGIEQVEIDRGR
jgi:hypothetical protein